LGEILVALQLVHPRELYRILADQIGIDRVNSMKPMNVHHQFPESLARQYGAVVIEECDTHLSVAVTQPLSSEERTAVSSYFSKPIREVLATPYEMERFWDQVFRSELLEESIERLHVEQPRDSAMSVLTRSQLALMIAIFVGVVVCAVMDFLRTVTVINILCQLVYFSLATFKARVLYRGMSVEAHSISDDEVKELDENELPIYTILVPLYREANVLPELIRHIENMDYPKHKLDVRLLFEEDDVETISQAERLQIPYYFTFVKVPVSQPRTKPKACNYGLIRARGEYVVIYDAEDRPEPDQLKKVLVAFRKLGKKTACVQAKLNYFNGNQNLLTRWFTQEYSNWFGILLPGVMSMKLPIPLGGTSNHFRMSVLKQINAWDPYNVTEDADLGVRLYKSGHTTGIVDSTTWEEANSRLYNWVKQRTRWIKGYMQTWLVHMRNPWRLYRQLGGRGFWGFQAIVLGTPLLPLMNPPFWVMMFLWFFQHQKWIPEIFPGPIYYMAACLLVMGNFFFVYSGVVGTYQFSERYMHVPGVLSFRLVRSAIISPLYWALMSIAAYRAVWQLVVNPFYWEKTRHGLTRSTRQSGQSVGITT
jgi:cellulose synthase/poly-beta-1,6-N-acetylglucosamine synthase-like glycosyltransferase